MTKLKPAFLGCVVQVLLCACSILVLVCSVGAQEPLKITLKHDSQRERETKAQLERLLQQYDLTAWLFTREVLIDEQNTPHSHPVLTLHTRHFGDDQRLLTTFIHEQIHRSLTDWPERRDARDKTIEELKALFPVVPQGRPYGARSASSTYLHLIVCYLELEALKSFLGERPARRVLATQTHYVWIYATVLSNVGETVGEIVRKHHLDQYPSLSD